MLISQSKVIEGTPMGGCPPFFKILFQAKFVVISPYKWFLNWKLERGIDTFCLTVSRRARLQKVWWPQKTLQKRQDGDTSLKNMQKQSLRDFLSIIVKFNGLGKRKEKQVHEKTERYVWKEEV